MLGFIFLFFIGYYYYRLAENYSKGKWKYAALGIGCYYLATIIYGLGYGLFYGLFYPDDINEIDELSIGLVSIGVGIFCCVVLFQYLDYKWKKDERKEKKDYIDEIGKVK